MDTLLELLKAKLRFFPEIVSLENKIFMERSFFALYSIISGGNISLNDVTSFSHKL